VSSSLSAMASAPTARGGFADIPARVFLDSSVLQTFSDYGDVIFDNAEPSPGDRAFGMPGFLSDLDALRVIFEVFRRGSFQLVVSGNTFAEVRRKEDPFYSGLAVEMGDYWLQHVKDGASFSGSGIELAKLLDSPTVGYLSRGDRELLKDAVRFECAVFLTMEKKLPTQAAKIAGLVPLRVLRPPEYWELLRPWAALFL
jgi:hypothetical protein